MKVFKGIELKIDVITHRCIIAHFNIPLFLEPELKVHNKTISMLHDTHSLIDLDEYDCECDDEECEGCEKCKCDEDLNTCASLVEMIQNIKGVDTVNICGHAIVIAKADFFYKWKDVINELMQILLLNHNNSTGKARLIKIEFKDGAKKDIGKENLNSFVKEFPKKYNL